MPRIFRDSDGSIVIHFRTGRSSCRDKIRYATMERATRAAYHLDEVRVGESFEPYRCDFCLEYHVGHSRS
jgi:hypothetical protein